MTLENNELVELIFYIDNTEKTLQFKCNLKEIMNKHLDCNGHTFLFMNHNLSPKDRKRLLINFLKRTDYHSYDIINKTELWSYFEKQS